MGAKTSCVLLVAGVLAVVRAGPPATRNAATATKPSAAPQADLCAGAVDPYDQPGQKERFFKAAGVDGELEAKELHADQAAPGGFARSFDRWATMIRHDKDRNRTIDWFEADAYRQALRKRILARFDADKDGKLTGAERRAANRALAAGGLRGAPTTMKAPAATAVAPRRPMPAGGIWPSRKKLLEQYDADRDGKLSPEEMQAARRAIGREFRKRLLARYDTNGDGGLDGAERKAMLAERAQSRKRAETQWFLRHFDDNGNGKLDEDEQAALKDFQGRLRGVGQQLRRRLLDIDGDGQVTPEERTAGRLEMMRFGLAMMLKVQRLMDLDGDGTVSEAEREDFGRRARKGMQAFVEKFARRFDANGNGRLDPPERPALIDGVRKEFDRRAAAHDANRDGRLNADEMLDLAGAIMREIGLAPPAAD